MFISQHDPARHRPQRAHTYELRAAAAAAAAAHSALNVAAFEIAHRKLASANTQSAINKCVISPEHGVIISREQSRREEKKIKSTFLF
jgi:hypothetical protein